MLDDLRGLVPTQIRRSYAAKFGIVLLVIGVSVGLIGSAATVQITNEVQTSVNGEYSGLATQEASTIEQWIERNKLSTRLSAESIDVKRGIGQTINSYLESKLKQLPNDVVALHVVDMESGELVESTSTGMSGSQGMDPATQEWWNSAQEADGANSDTVLMSQAYEVDSQPVIAFTTAVPDSSRVLVISFKTREVARNTFQGGARTAGGFTTVVNGDNEIIFDRTQDRILTSYPDDATGPIEQARADGGSTDVVAMPANPAVFPADQQDQYRNGDYLVGYAPVEGTDWVVLVHAPQSEAYGFVTTVSRFGLLATLGGMLLIAVLGTFLGRNTASAIDRLTAKTQRMEEGDLSVDFETKRIDNIGRLYEAFGSMRDALREQIQEAQAARREAEEARESAEMMTRHLVEKADEYSDVMEQVADGDMTQRMDPESRSDAMEEIALEFNEMIQEIEATTEQVKDFATEVATSSEEVTASSEEVKSASEQVTESIQEISDGAERQNDQLQSVSNEMNSLSTTIEEIASSANEVADLSQQTAETGDEARENAEQAIVEMETVEDEAEATVDAMERLQAQMEQIEEITEFITEVAEQTNILALNANIEAARAGEAGEGFAVVADEVKSLAEETRDAAEEIDQLVEDLRAQTETTAEEVEQTSDEVARSTEIVEETVDSLEKIAGYAKETNTGVQEISDATTEQASSTNQVVGMVDEAASISEQTSRESENVAAAAEEQTTALTEVTNSASALAEQASRLSSALERFETDSEGPSPGMADEDVAETVEDDADHEKYRPDDEDALAIPTEDPLDALMERGPDMGGDDSPPDADEPEVVDVDDLDAFDDVEDAADDSTEADAVDASATAEPDEAEVDGPDEAGDGDTDIAEALGVDLDTDASGNIEVGDIESVVGTPERDDGGSGEEGATDERDETTEGDEETTAESDDATTGEPAPLEELVEDLDDADGSGVDDDGDDDSVDGVDGDDGVDGVDGESDREGESGDDGESGGDAPAGAGDDASAADESASDVEDTTGDAMDEWLEAQVDTVDEPPEMDDTTEDTED